MFYPEEMTEIELIVPAKDLLAVTKVLGEQAIFQQSDSSYLTGESELAQPKEWQDKASAYAALERRIQTTMQALELAEGKPPKKGFDAPADIKSVQAIVDQLEGEVRKTSEQLTNETKHIEFLEGMLRQLQPVADIDIDLSKLHSSHSLFSVLGVMPVENMDRLQTSLSRIPFVFLPLHQEGKEAVVWLAGSNANSDILKRAVTSSYLNPLTLPEDVKGKPAEIITSLHDQIASSKNKVAELKGTLVSLREAHTQRLQRLLWEIRSSRMLTNAIVRYGRLKYTYLIVGWAIASKIPQLQERLKKISNEILVETFPVKRGEVKQNVPVALFNNKFLKPFQMLVNTYARPLYGELDPTLLIAITFPLLYGAMFGDLGQGLVLLVLGLLIHIKIFAKGLQSLGLLIAYCGAAAAVFGSLYGSIFGFEGSAIDTYLHFHLEPLWFSPIQNILSILSIAIDAGIVILLFAFLLGIFNNIRARDWAHVIFGHTGLVSLAFYITFLAFLGFFLGPTVIAPKIAVAIYDLPLPLFPLGLGIFGVLVMFSGFFRNLVEGHRPLIEGKGIGGFFMFLVQSFMDLFETGISMVSNTLSFVRVGAFAVAHGGLSLAIFSLAGTEPNLKFWIVILIGNLIIIGLEGLIVGIQTMRLHYYEMFGKFFTGGGMRFEPLQVTPSDEEG